jgi:GAF domain-containing protein
MALKKRLIEQREIESEDSTFASVDALCRAASHLTFLSEAGRILASSIHIEQTFSNLVGLLVPALADWCTISIVEENGSIRRLAVGHIDTKSADYMNSIKNTLNPDLTSSIGVPYSIRTGQSQIIARVTTDQKNEISKQLSYLPPNFFVNIDFHSGMSVPMILPDKRIIGAIWLALSEDKTKEYTHHDLNVVQDISLIAAEAVENSILYSQANNELEKMKVLEFVRENYIQRQIHDLKSPLTALSMTVQLMERISKDIPRIDILADKARDSIRKAVQMINNMKKPE